MKTVGLCGGSGSGKGTFCSFFEEMGIPCIDTDLIYRRLVSSRTPCLNELALAFGENIIENDSLNRPVMASIAFSSPEAHRLLNSITHKHVLGEVRRIISECELSGVPGVVVDAPLLFESGFDKECDVTVCVIADIDVRISRIMERDGINKEKALARIGAQIPDEEISARCDYTVENNGSCEELKNEARMLAKTIFDI